jgi:hypothetical protein
MLVQLISGIECWTKGQLTEDNRMVIGSRDRTLGCLLVDRDSVHSVRDDKVPVIL